MEILLAIIAIIFFIARNAARVKENTRTDEERPQPAQSYDEAEIFRPGAEGYREESSGKKESQKYYSSEGSKSTEGECIEPNPSHCVTEHVEDSVYATEISDEEVEFDRESLVKGIIMAEIITKPKW